MAPETLLTGEAEERHQALNFLALRATMLLATDPHELASHWVGGGTQ